MLRVAVCVSGQIRHPEIGLPSLKESILQGVQADFYICTYAGPGLESAIRQCEPLEVLTLPKELEEDITEIAHERRFPETNVKNMYLMFRNVYKCFSLLRHDYDLVIRARTDQVFRGKINLNSPNQNLRIPSGGDHRGGILDHFAIGPQDQMRYYCSLFKKLNYYIESGVLAHPETLLKHHLLFRQSPPLTIERPDLPIFLVRNAEENQLFVTDATPNI